MMKIRNKNIIWAIDPFEDNLSLDRESVTELCSRFEKAGATIQPVYVFAPIGPVERLAADKITEIIGQFFANLGVKTLPAKVLTELTASQANGAQAILDYAKSTHASLIIANSHGRSGLVRIFLGSFMERLLALSTVPVLFLNRHKRSADLSLDKVMWATDFSGECLSAYENFLEQANGVFSEIVLFNDVSLFYDITKYYAGGEWPIVPQVDAAELNASAARDCETWSSLARTSGFKAENCTVVGFRSPGREILSAAKGSGCGLIAMASHVGPFGSLIFGSQARQVFRESCCPVWVYGPYFCEAQRAIKLLEEVRDANQ